MPLAMAALDVAGHVRERSPGDLAIFGEAAAKLVDRFVERERGQALLARAVTDGSAEGVAWLVTSAGQQRFRVGLWRQRGGERIRLLAAFSACESVPADDDLGLAEPTREALLTLGHDMRAPLTAVMGFAERIRAGGLGAEVAASHASDIVAAAWRLMRIAEDIETSAGSGTPRIPAVPGEVDLARLVRRVARLAGPEAEAAGVAVDLAGLPGRGEGPLVLGDERTLWSVIDSLIENALRHAGRGAEVRLQIAVPDGRQGVVLEIADNGPGLEAETLARLLEGRVPGRGIALSRALARANGAELEFDSAPGRGLTARLTFPPARCLDPV